MSSVVLAAGETDKAKWLDSLKSGTVLLIPKKYIKTKCKQTRKKIHTHTKKKKIPHKTISIEFTTVIKSVIKSVLVTNASCGFYDMTND